MDKFGVLERQIRDDLTPFCDPGTGLELVRTGSTFSACWKQRRRDRRAVFELTEPFEINVRLESDTFTYRSFFASEEMSDLYGIAQTSLSLYSADGYVETSALLGDASSSEESKAATELIRSLVEVDAASRDGTSFTMVTGEAGAGKTWVLKELVRRQAQAYCEGRATYVYLYIDAQGRALAKFHEALSTELNELRVGLPYHAVAPMVRLGLIVPVVDGFDELIGVGGYDDAFSSISNFVNELRGQGAIVASARSTYYEQEFLSRVGKGGDANQWWRLQSVQVIAWGSEQRQQFVSTLADDGPTEEALASQLRAIFSGPNEGLAEKPLFFARTASLLASGGEISGDGSLTEQLIEAFITRELKDKLLDRNGNQILSRDELWSLAADLSEEMWNQSTRELDKATVRDVAEYAMADSNAPESSKAIVIERMPSMAFLRRGDSEGSLAFEHEIFFDHFLAKRLSARLSIKSPSTTVLLSRSSMPDELSNEIANAIVGESGVDLSAQIQVLSASASATAIKQGTIRENCGRLFAAIVRRAGGVQLADRTVVQNMIFPGSDFSGLVLERVDFKVCEFKRVDFVATKIYDCSFELSLLDAPLVSLETRIEKSEMDFGDNVIGLRVAEPEGGIRFIYDPTSLRAQLRTLGVENIPMDALDTLRDVDPEALELLEKVARAYKKCNPVSFEDDQNSGIAGSVYWDQLKRIAVDTGVLRSEVRAAHGPRREFLRRAVRFEDLLIGRDRSAPVSEEIRKFWDAFEAQFDGL